MSEFKLSLGNSEEVEIWMLEDGDIGIGVVDRYDACSASLTADEARRVAFALLAAVGDVEVMAKESKQ